jgi:hypothetical protein
MRPIKPETTESDGAMLSNDQLSNDIDDLLAVENRLQAKLALLRRARDDLKRERIARGLKTRSVSDHAIVRYLERCKGTDVERFREELRAMVSECVETDDGEHIHPSGALLVLGQDGQIVTVVGKEQRAQYLRKKGIKGA